jgi:FxLD family lantipeptide
VTVLMDQVAAAPATPATAAADEEFDLDVSIVESGPVIAELMRLTDDNCGSTCESACTSCP